METPDPRAYLLELAEARSVSLAQLSALIGRNNSYLQQFIRKGSPRSLAETDRRVLARFFGVEESQLGASEEISYEFSKIASTGQWIDIPRLALGASAGPGTIPSEEQAIGVFRFSARWLRAQGFDPAMLSAIQVSGDSMEPTLRDGDEILVDRAPHPLRDGIHVVRIEDAILVKRLNTIRPSLITMISDNIAYPAFEVATENIQIIGRVVWKSGRL